MQVRLNYHGHAQFQAIARNHTIWGDQPCDNQGDDIGMTPPEWFLASLGSCIGFYAVHYCQTRDLDATGLTVDVSAQKVADPARLDHIQVRVNLPLALDDRHRTGLERAVKTCLIHNTLTHPPTMTTQITSGQPIAENPFQPDPDAIDRPLGNAVAHAG
ncbi:hypothetical protein BST81_14950 [Leptolyngbya sp. 'hensonii']|uniref:OsmC family protein n=1 Tax=Leptolyngbya sp. 'hensonii' TaxID=1922337 RepID=UPI00094F8073|nr:OsmC family protein [Leptolyngbya sp. 'hensonii']OLP17620.1 hypothetical protein BST81_14950 [Leptolyngbya sp. 'hensonii']